jgi:hypothetical protein
VRQPRRVWRVPAALALVTVTSLLGALVADGIWDGAAALALAGVLAVTAGAGWRRRFAGGRSRPRRQV